MKRILLPWLSISLWILCGVLASIVVLQLTVFSENQPKFTFAIMNFTNQTPNQEIDFLEQSFPMSLAAELSESTEIKVLQPKEVQFAVDQAKRMHGNDFYSYAAELLHADALIDGTYGLKGTQFYFEGKCYLKQAAAFDIITKTGSYPDELISIQKEMVDRIITNLEWHFELAQFRERCGTFYRSLVILVDSSNSMNDDHKIQRALEICSEILDRIKPENTEVAVIKFSGSGCKTSPIQVVHPFSNNVQSIKASLTAIKPHSGTPLSRAITDTIAFIEQYHKGRVGHVVVIGDGQDDCKNIQMAQQSVNQSIMHVSLDTIGLDIKENSTTEEDLRSIAENLGGTYYRIDNNPVDPAHPAGLQSFLKDPDIQKDPCPTISSPVYTLSY